MIPKYEIADLFDPDNHRDHCGVLDEDCLGECDCGYWAERLYAAKKMFERERERIRKGGEK